MKKNWNGFAKKSIQERLELVKSQALTSMEAQERLEQNENLSMEVRRSPLHFHSVGPQLLY